MSQTNIDLEGWNLHRAAKENRVDVAQLLIEKGANTDGIDLSWMN